jgi:predicted small secreted protein
MKTISLLFAMFMAMVALTGCNTFEGFGKDLSTLGDKIQQGGKEK